MVSSKGCLNVQWCKLGAGVFVCFIFRQATSAGIKISVCPNPAALVLCIGQDLIEVEGLARGELKQCIDREVRIKSALRVKGGTSASAFLLKVGKAVIKRSSKGINDTGGITEDQKGRNSRVVIDSATFPSVMAPMGKAE